MYSSTETFQPGDIVVTTNSCAYSTDCRKMIMCGTPLTVSRASDGYFIARECFGYTFLIRDFEKTRSSLYRKEGVQFEEGDTVTPKDAKGAVSTHEEVRIEFGKNVTIKAVTVVENPNGPDRCFFTVKESFGIFCAEDFKRTKGSPNFVASEGKAVPQKVKVQKEPPPDPSLPHGKRAVKKHFEKIHKCILVWKDGYLCFKFKSNGKRIPNSPYRPD